MNIKALIYARYSTSSTIYKVNRQTSNKYLAADIDKIPQKIKALKAKQDQRNQLKTDYGVWYVTHDQNDVSYALCTQENYPERHAFGLIQKLKQKIAQINHCQYQTQQNIKSQTKKTANELVQRYNDLTKVDKLAKANVQVQGLKQQIGTGIKKIMGNQQTLNNMQIKAERLKNYAGQFEKNSQALERMLYWRNCKIKIIVGICILCLIAFVILIIVQRTKNTNNQ